MRPEGIRSLVGYSIGTLAAHLVLCRVQLGEKVHVPRTDVLGAVPLAQRFPPDLRGHQL
jgi:hypothetical protein